MLAVLSPLGNLNSTHQSAEMEAFSVIGDDEFPDFSSGNLLENIDFDNLFSNSDVLPDLEMDPFLLAEFSLCSGDKYCSDINTSTTTASVEKTAENSGDQSYGMDSIESGIMYVLETCCVTSKNDQEMVSKRDSDLEKTSKEELTSSSKKKVVNNNRHSKAHRRNNKPLGVSSKGTCKEGLKEKKKVKMDWTPELHRRFVQAVEQLGVDKAVPSRILEVMGIDCLTRHNIASHLQKYRSHIKHLLAREAEAVSWSQRRHAYAPIIAGEVLGKRESGSPWLLPSLGFSPAPPQRQHVVHGHNHNNRPFHVWGHPSVDQSVRHVLPKPLPHSPSAQPPPIWHSHVTRDSSLPYWHSSQIVSQHIRNGLCQGVSCFPPPLGTTQRVPVPPTQRFPHQALHKVEPNGHAVPVGQSRANSFSDLHPTKESVDAAIGDVLSKPWLPLPIGLKPPKLDSVMGELKRNGISNIPSVSA